MSISKLDAASSTPVSNFFNQSAFAVVKLQPDIKNIGIRFPIPFFRRQSRLLLGSLTREVRMRTGIYIGGLVLLMAITIGCGRGSSKGTGGTAGDSDGDGLADADEINIYHTSPETKDTDGDGYDDYQEIRELGFDRSNPTKFNPLVADVPRITIEIISAPEVTVTYSKSTSSGNTIENGSTVTDGRTDTTSRGGEISVSSTVSATAGFSGFKPEASVTASLTMGAQENWSKQQSYETQRALSQMRSNSYNSELHTDGGQMRVVAAISNTGHIPFTLQNLALTAARLDKNKPLPIAQLEADSARPFFEMGTWVPGERTESVFIARNMPLSDIEAILTGKLIVEIGKYELKDANGQSFGHRVGAINAACAQVVIYYGNNVPVESYMVSTRTAPDERGMPLSTIFDALGVRSQMGKVAWTYRKLRNNGQLSTNDAEMETGETQTGLLRVNEVSTDPQHGGHWIILHATPSGSSEFVTRTYDILKEGYRLEDIRLKPRHAVQLAYIRDPDRDDLPTKTELALGTNPMNADTDGDGVADGDEVRNGTNPLPDKKVQVKTIVPSVVKMTREKAIQLLDGFKLRHSIQTREEKNQKDGIVLQQTPVADAEVEQGATVTLIVSALPKKNTVPAVFGKTQDEAIKLLETAGFGWDAIKRPHPGNPAGSVISQSPGGGIEANRGAKVILVVSSGPLAPVRITFKHSGVYVAKFYLSYDDDDGHHDWASGRKARGYTETVILDMYKNPRNVHTNAQYLVFRWHTIWDRTLTAPLTSATWTTKGTTASAGFTISQ